MPYPAKFLRFLYFPALLQLNVFAHTPSSLALLLFFPISRTSCLYSVKGVFPLTARFLRPPILTTSHPTAPPLTQLSSRARQRPAPVRKRTLSSRNCPTPFLSLQDTRPCSLNASTTSFSAFRALSPYQTSISLLALHLPTTTLSQPLPMSLFVRHPLQHSSSRPHVLPFSKEN